MKIYEFSTQQEQAAALAQAISKQIKQLLTQKPQVTLAVSGGKSPIILFGELSRCQLPWEQVVITLVDERFLATDHADSNEKMVRQHLLINHAEKAHFVGLVTTSNPLTSISNANLNINHIDIAILGMGEDGHTASLFADCPEYKRAIDPLLTPERYLITTPTQAKYQRLGLSLAGITAIPYLYLSINGEKKREVLKSALLNPQPNYPISQLLAHRSNLEIYWSV